MTGPVCEIVEVPRLPEECRRHPMATRTGAELLGYMVAAGQHWRPLTERCRDALRLAYQDALADAIRTGATTVPLPLLPAGTHPATRRALIRRGLATNERLTPLGVEVCRYALSRRRGRPVSTLHPAGGVL